VTGTDYSTYLHIDELLRLQSPLTDDADDEMLFIVVHQSYELWFKLILHELGLARDRLFEGKPWAAAPRLRRATLVEDLLLRQLGVLETMSPEGFLEFRDPLAPASGFQSTQFREIEALSGRTFSVAGDGFLASDEQREAIRRQAASPSLWDGLVATLRAVGALAPDGEDVLDALVELYRHHADPARATAHEICELLVDHDEAIARWRYRHALMAAREIGRRQGTGGSLGVAYLETTLEGRFFPLLWEVRSKL
jgi:tryptophan 2,3-dioxygenase